MSKDRVFKVHIPGGRNMLKRGATVTITPRSGRESFIGAIKEVAKAVKLRAGKSSGSDEHRAA